MIHKYNILSVSFKLNTIFKKYFNAIAFKNLLKRTAAKKTQSDTDYFVIFMPQKSIYAVFRK